MDSDVPQELFWIVLTSQSARSATRRSPPLLSAHGVPCRRGRRSDDELLPLQDRIETVADDADLEVVHSIDRISKNGPGDRSKLPISMKEFGAGEGIRTLDPNLGKVVLYP
jgi:hypothetical protein